MLPHNELGIKGRIKTYSNGAPVHSFEGDLICFEVLRS
jgi:hypothetical protein